MGKMSGQLKHANIHQTLSASTPLGDIKDKNLTQNVMQAENIYKHLMMGDLQSELDSTNSQISQLLTSKSTKIDNISYYKSENKRLGVCIDRYKKMIKKVAII